MVFVTIFGLYFEAAAQFPQARRNEERRQQAIEADEKRQKENAAKDDPSIPQPKTSVVNKNVRIVLSGKNFKNFDEAASEPKNKVGDGEDLWLYLKIDTKLGDYVLTQPDTENRGAFKYLLYADISPQNDPTVLAKYIIQFSREDLELKELKINLSPGMKGRNAAIPVFLDVAASRSPGIWNNQLRIANKNIAPRLSTDDLANVPLTFALPASVSKYKKIKEDFESMRLRGTTDEAILPEPGMFYNLPLKTAIQNYIKDRGIQPLRFYFAGDGWEELGASTLYREPQRSLFAVFTYREKDICFYGVAKVTQKMDMMTSKFVGDEIEIVKDLKVACSEVE